MGGCSVGLCRWLVQRTVENKELPDERALMRCLGSVVLKPRERGGELVEDDEIEELERDAPDRRVEQVECDRLPCRRGARAWRGQDRGEARR